MISLFFLFLRNQYFVIFMSPVTIPAQQRTLFKLKLAFQKSTELDDAQTNLF